MTTCVPSGRRPANFGSRARPAAAPTAANKPGRPSHGWTLWIIRQATITSGLSAPGDSSRRLDRAWRRSPAARCAPATRRRVLSRLECLTPVIPPRRHETGERFDDQHAIAILRDRAAAAGDGPELDGGSLTVKAARSAAGIRERTALSPGRVRAKGRTLDTLPPLRQRPGMPIDPDDRRWRATAGSPTGTGAPVIEIDERRSRRRSPSGQSPSAPGRTATIDGSRDSGATVEKREGALAPASARLGEPLAPLDVRRRQRP